jgi:hypothetical protein
MATQWTAGTTSGQVLTAATLNTIGAVWETWTPVLSGSATNPNLGTTGTSIGRYARINKIVIAQAAFTFGGASIAAGSGFYKINLPFTAQGSSPASGTVLAVDVSSFSSTANVAYLDSTTQALGVGTGGAGFNASIGSATYVWAAGDFIRFLLIYEAA